MTYNFQRWMSRFPQRWRTQRNAIRNANCKTSWIIKILNAHCAFGIFPEAYLSECLWIPLSVGLALHGVLAGSWLLWLWGMYVSLCLNSTNMYVNRSKDVSCLSKWRHRHVSHLSLVEHLPSGVWPRLAFSCCEDWTESVLGEGLVAAEIVVC